MPGDVILQVGSIPVGSAQEWRDALAKLRRDGRRLGMLLIFQKDSAESDPTLRAPKWLPVRMVEE